MRAFGSAAPRNERLYGEIQAANVDAVNLILQQMTEAPTGRSKQAKSHMTHAVELWPSKPEQAKQCLEALIKKGASLDINDASTDTEYTPFYKALELHANELAERIIGHPEFDRNEKCHKEGGGPFYWATHFCEPDKPKADILRLLCRGLQPGNDAPINKQAGDSLKKNSALMLAAQKNRLDLFTILLQYGANVDLKNSDGKTAKDLAPEESKVGIEAILKMTDVLTRTIDVHRTESSGHESEIKGVQAQLTGMERQLGIKTAALQRQDGKVRALVNREQQHEVCLRALKAEKDSVSKLKLLQAPLAIARSRDEQIKRATEVACKHQDQIESVGSTLCAVAPTEAAASTAHAWPGLPPGAPSTAWLVSTAEGKALLRTIGVTEEQIARDAATTLKCLRKVHHCAVMSRALAPWGHGGQSARGEDWTREHPTIVKSTSTDDMPDKAGSAGQQDAAGLNKKLARLLAPGGGTLEVLDGGGVLDESGGLRACEPGQTSDAASSIRPLPGGSFDTRFFALEASASVNTDAPHGGEPGFAPGAQLVLTGRLPVGPSMEPDRDLAVRQANSVMLQTLAGDLFDSKGRVVHEGSPFVARVLHFWLGSPSLMARCMEIQNQLGCAQKSKALWTVEERCPASLQEVFDQCWAKGGKISGAQAALWMQMALQGVLDLLRRGIVHMDITAENIGMTEDGRVILRNFQRAKCLYQNGTIGRALRAAEKIMGMQVGVAGEAPGHSRDSAVPGEDPAADGQAGNGDTAATGGANDEDDDPAGAGAANEQHAEDTPAPSSPQRSPAQPASRHEDFGRCIRVVDEMQASVPPAKGTQAYGSLYVGSGNTAEPIAYAPATVRVESRRGNPAQLSPEARRLLTSSEDVMDGAGRRITTLPQALGSGDVWAVAVIFYTMFAKQAELRDKNVQLPRLTSAPGSSPFYDDAEIQDLPPEAGCPQALETIIRGCLQSSPQSRMPLEHAIQALEALRMGPQSEDELRQLAGEYARCSQVQQGGSKTAAGALPGNDRLVQWVWVQQQALFETALQRPVLPMTALLGDDLAREILDNRAELDQEHGESQGILVQVMGEEDVEAAGADSSADADPGQTGEEAEAAPTNGPASGAGSSDPVQNQEPVPATPPTPPNSSSTAAPIGVDVTLQMPRQLHGHALIEEFVVGAQPGRCGSSDQQSEESELVPASGDLSFGLVGAHKFPEGLDRAVGSGVLQYRKDPMEMPRAVIRAGPTAALCPPRTGTRCGFGWGTGLHPCDSHPLACGMVSMHDAVDRQRVLGADDAVDRIGRGMVSLVKAMDVFGRGRVSSGGKVAGWGHQDRDMRWMPSMGTVGAAQGGASGASSVPSGPPAQGPTTSLVARETYHVDGRGLPMGWQGWTVLVNGVPGGYSYKDGSSGKMCREIPDCAWGKGDPDVGQLQEALQRPPCDD